MELEFEIDINALLSDDKERAKAALVEMLRYAEDLATNDASNQLKLLYKEIITQYYKYRTIRYVRHGEPRSGTKHGSNLYDTFDMYADRVGDTYNQLIRLWGDRIAGYTQVVDGSDVDPDLVVDKVISGSRPMIPWISDDLPFIADIHSPILGNFSGTPFNILNSDGLWDALSKYRQERFDYYSSALLSRYIN